MKANNRDMIKIGYSTIKDTLKEKKKKKEGLFKKNLDLPAVTLLLLERSFFSWFLLLFDPYVCESNTKIIKM